MLTDIYDTMRKYNFTISINSRDLKVLFIFPEWFHKNFLIVLHNTKWMPNINVTCLDGDLSK